MPKFMLTSAHVVLSESFIEDVMIGLSSLQLKAYILIRLYSQKNQLVDFDALAAKLGITITELESTVGELCSLGVITLQDGIYSFCENIPTTNETLFEPHSHSKVQDKALSELVMLAQELLGKPLNSADSQTLIWICENLGFSAEVVLMVIEHCVALNKRNMSYIEQVAISWSNQGVRTIDDVERIIGDGASAFADAKNNLKFLFQINDRDFSKLELEFIEKWINDYAMSEDMVALAYEYCIIQLGKMSFPYMDGIISSWVQSGISTVEAATKEHDEHSTKNQTKPSETSTVKTNKTISNDRLTRILELGK